MNWSIKYYQTYVWTDPYVPWSYHPVFSHHGIMGHPPNPCYPGPGPDEETSGELLGAPHRSFGPGVLSGIAPAIGSTAAELWLARWFQDVELSSMFGVVLVSHPSTTRDDDFSVLKSPSYWPGRLKRGHWFWSWRLAVLTPKTLAPLWTLNDFFSVQMEVVPLVQCEGSGSPQIGALRVLQTPWSSWHLTTSRFWCYKELNWFVFGMRRSKLDEMTHGLLPHFFSSCQYFWPIYFGMTP